MKRIINKILIMLYALYFHFRYYHFKQEENNQNILFIYHSLIGDAILFTDYLAMFQQVFPKEKGYELEILCRKNCKQVWEELFAHEYHIKFADVYIDNDKVETWRSYREILRFFMGKYYRKIFVLQIAAPRGDRFAYNIVGKEKIVCGENELPGRWGFPYLYHRYFYEHAYNSRIQDPMGTMEIRRYANLIARYADFPVPVKISHILVKEEEVSEKYCVVGVGASISEKMWEIDKFAEIIQYLWNRYHLISYLCGGENEKFLVEQLIKTGKCDHIKSYVGKTNLQKWVSLIKGAVLYVGNDSAGVHIAASVYVPSIVIVGKWQYGRYFPYDKELDTGQEMLPYPVFSEQQYACVNCREKYMRKGIGNRACKKGIKAGKPCLCVADITVKQVKEAIDRTIVKYNIEQEG